MDHRLISVPYDSGHRGRRIGAGPLHLVEAGARDQLVPFGHVTEQTIEARSEFPTEIGTAFELHRLLAQAVAETLSSGARPIVLAGNCNSSLGILAGIQAVHPGKPIGVIWFDGHCDCNTPDRFVGDFLDAMGISTLTGRCWRSLAATVPEFTSIEDEDVVLVGAHGADAGGVSVLNSSRISVISPESIQKHGLLDAVRQPLDALGARSIESVYLHINVDVLDATHFSANEFAPIGRLDRVQLRTCVETVSCKFSIEGAGIASYDPVYDASGGVRDVVLDILEVIANSP